VKRTRLPILSVCWFVLAGVWIFFLLVIAVSQEGVDVRAALHDAAPSGQDSYLSIAKHIKAIPEQF
jgi:hypothetical protein